MALQVVLAQMIVLALIIAVGFAAHRLKITNDAFDQTLTRVVLDITLPCMILGSVLTAQEAFDAQTVLVVLGISLLISGALAGLAFIFPHFLRVEKADRGAFAFMAAFGNVGFMGFPVVESIFGSNAILYGAINNIPFNILVFTAGVIMISGTRQDANAGAEADGDGGAAAGVEARRTGAAGVGDSSIGTIAGETGASPATSQQENLLKRIISPTILACLAAMLLALAGVHNVAVLGDAFKTMGAATTPCALMLLGSSLAHYPLREVLSDWRPYVASAVRLVIMPLAALLITLPFEVDPVVRGTLVVLAGMPVATNGLLFAIRYHGNQKVMTQGIFISTAISVVSIPLLVWTLALLGFL